MKISRVTALIAAVEVKLRVNKAIKKYIDPSNVKMVVYSSAEVAPQLKAIKGATVTIKRASEYQ